MTQIITTFHSSLLAYRNFYEYVLGMKKGTGDEKRDRLLFPVAIVRGAPRDRPALSEMRR